MTLACLLLSLTPSFLMGDHGTIGLAILGMFLGLLGMVKAVDTVDTSSLPVLDQIQLKHKPKLDWLKPGELRPHPENPRDPANFSVADHDFMITLESFKKSGFLPGYPLIVHLDADGKYTVLCGHRRREAAIQAGVDSVLCVVLTGLNAAEQSRLVHDHRQTIGLKDAGLLRSFKTLKSRGFSNSQICGIMGFKTRSGKDDLNAIKRFNDVAVLPPIVQKIWGAYRESGRDATIPDPADSAKSIKLPFVPDTDAIKAINEAINKDRISSNAPVLPQDGSAYKAVVIELSTRGKKSKDFYDKGMLKDLFEHETGRSVLRQLFGRFAGELPDVDVDECLRVIRACVDSTLGLADGVDRVTLTDHLRAKYGPAAESTPTEPTPVKPDSEPTPVKPDSEPTSSKKGKPTPVRHRKHA